MRLFRIAVVVLGLLPLWSATAAAQDSPHRYLPPAEALGAGWVVIEQIDLEVNTEAFRDGARSVYGGPNGARAIVAVYRLTDASAIRRSWELSNESFKSYAHQHADDWFWNDDDLVGIPAPAGCADVKRGEGPDGYFGIPAGVMLCAVDPEAVLLVVASGEVAGETGYRAADAVVTAALTAGLATPTP